MKAAHFIILALVVCAWSVGVRGAVVIETVPVGNPGNPNDTHGDGYGGVGYTYDIAKFEVTAGQYRDFLNAVDPTGSNPYGLYNSNMNGHSFGCQITWNARLSTYDFSGRPSGTEADWADRPVNLVSWFDALRFANWLHNGQGSGSTENGAYDMSLSLSVVRRPGAKWVLPTEDEWYKAAYHKNDGMTGSYWDYPTSNDSMPSNDLVASTDPGNNATFDDGNCTIGSPYWRTESGAHENSDSPYGTFDQGGNVAEWNEAAIGSYRGLRGGSLCDGGSDYLHAAYRGNGVSQTYENSHIGFRVVEVTPPSFVMETVSVGNLGSLDDMPAKKSPLLKTVFDQLRPDKEDVIYFCNKDVLHGTVLNETLSINTPYGGVKVDLRKCAGVSFDGSRVNTEALVTVNRNRLTGIITDRTIRFRIGMSGEEINIRKEKIHFVLLRQHADEIDFLEPKKPRDLFVMTNGDLITGRPAEPRITVTTDYGSLTVALDDIRKIEMRAEKTSASSSPSKPGI